MSQLKLKGDEFEHLCVVSGCVVYHWDAKDQRVVNRLDCSKLVPCSESLQSISIEEHLSPSHCQVGSKHFISNTVAYIGCHTR